MVLVLAALTGTAFGTGVVVGLAIGGSTVACVYACREACRVGAGREASKPPAGGERRTAQAARPNEGLVRLFPEDRRGRPSDPPIS